MLSFTRLLPALLATGLLLTGCDSAPPREPAPTTASAPRFASDEEALAAAEKAYAAYLAVSDQIVREAGADDSRLASFVSKELFDETSDSYEYLRENDWRGIGATAFSIALQRYDTDSIVAYTCDDMTNTDLVDATGASVVKAGRRLHLPFEVEFDPNDSLRIVRKDYWADREC